jgi:O-antigen ligase
MNTRAVLVRFFWLAPVALFAEALRRTQSRGGLLALLASVAVLFVSRFGIRKGVLFAAVVVPVILGQFGGRQVDFSLSGGQDTGQLRIQMWSSALEVLKRSPIFGVGTNQTGNDLGRAVHNSFVQAYSDMGFFGGTLFVGAFYYAYHRMFQLKLRADLAADLELDSMCPFVMAAMTGYVITMTSTNHVYGVASYGILGLATAVIRLADGDEPPAGEALDGRMMKRLICVSILFLIAMNVYIRLSVRY